MATTKEEKNTEGIGLYESAFHLLPTIAEADVPAMVSKIRDVIESAGGAVFSEHAPEMRDLAYPMSTRIGNDKHTFDKAYFGWIVFEALPAAADTIRKEFEAMDDILRQLTIHTVPEDEKRSAVIARPVAPAEEESPAPATTDATEPEKPELSKEEKEQVIDEEIDKLVAEK